MAKARKKTDSTRASRDGHEFHEAWVARKAMRLLLPDGDLAGMAVEGLSPSDQENASSETVCVADLALYYGEHPSFADSLRTEIVQFKYSVAGKDSKFRASDAEKTVKKFADTYRDFKKRHGAKEVREKLRFRLVTNRPVFPALTEAIRGLAEGTRLTGEAKKQADRFKRASLLDDEQLAEFAGKCDVEGLAGNLGDIKKDLSNILADWSATREAVASSKLGKMRNMVRGKAGTEGEGRNVITRMDVLAALEIAREEDLLPCPSNLPEVGRIVEREQLSEVVALVPGLARPLLVHAAGGMGKTVFMRSLAEKLKDGHETVFFDCFAGGAYRSPEDSRHLPERGLIHIANTLAYRGLCDPVLPGSHDVPSLLKTFRRRLEQSVETLARVSPERKLLLFFDAIDNAEVGARARGEDCFPTLLLKSFRHDPPDGVKIVASSRSHRIPGDSALYDKFELSAFSREETKEYLRTRLPDASDVEIRVAQARSKGNPRILEHIVTDDGSLLDQSEIDKEIKLEELIRRQVENALSKATLNQGYKKDETDSFLAGLAVLPPPVPLDEYARSQGIEESAAESFAVDMRKLLERTEQGLTFRDEPTETLIREKYGSSEESLKRIADNLRKHQDQSVYAAKALPELLYRIGDGDQLFNLALDEETFPEAVTGTVGRRNIRYARIKTALQYAAGKRNYGQLVGLLVEMSTVAGADRLGAEYILDYPDLVVAAKDADAVRRLFETRPPWPGTRHARLAIANALSGDMDEAYRHAADTEEWIDHWRSQPREKRRIDLKRKSPKDMDIAAIPFVHAADEHLRKAGEFMKGWKYRYAYRVWEHVFAFSNQLSESGADFDFVAEELEGNIGGLTAALSFAESDRASRKKLVRKLSEACGSVEELEFNTDKGRQRKRRYNFAEGLCKACGIALSLGSRRESSSMLRLMPKTRPGMRAFFEDCDLTPSFIRNVAPLDVVLFLFRVALTAAAEKTEIREKNVMPEDLTSLCEDMEDDLGGEKFRKKLEKKINSLESVAYESGREAEQFINNRMNSLLSLVKALSRLLAAPEGKADEPFLDILNAWADAEKTVNSYGTEETSLFFRILGRKISTFSLWTRGDLGDASVKTYIERLRERERVEAETAIEVVGVLAKRPSMRQLAGEEAERARSLIELGDDVRDRAHLYADLARAMLPASVEEATEYFVTGLREMEAVGSENTYGFVNELLLFAASLEGEELDERDFHKLTSICELNITEEPEKFPWTAFGEGLSRVSGCRGLAKLSRWNEMKAPLSCTLQPYLTALVRDGKIEPEDALALNRLARPEEFSYGCHTGTLARVIKERPRENTKELVSEVITQFMRNHHGFAVYEAANELVAIAGRVLGDQSETAAYLKRARPLLEKSRKTLVLDDLLDPPNERNGHSAAERGKTTRGGDKEIAEIVARSDDMDMKSFEKAIDDFMNIEHRRNLRETFFEEIRKKVPYEKRTDYVRMLAGHGTLNFHGKLDELGRCRNDWESSSTSLPKVYKEEIGTRTLLRHAEDIVASGQLPLYELGRFPEIFGISIPALAVELVKSFTGRGRHVAREVWLGLAHIVCGEAQREGKEALVRLLKGPATRLSDNASDGEWKPGLYPEDSVEIFSGMLWRMLGSSLTEDRWRAAHSVRCFARFKRWKVLDALVEKINRGDAGAFQASERRFCFMHAKLWLLIALARIALDEPKAAARYKDVFLKTAFDEENRHVLMKHFAAEAVGACLEAGEVRLSDGEENSLRRINKSPFPQLAEKIMTKDDFYDRRPESHPEPDFELSLDGHFYEYDVKSLGKVFGKAGWKVKDVMSEIVRSNHPEIESGRDFEEEAEEWAFPAFGAMTHMSSHTYGQQLGWHALFMAAGRLLGEYAVTKDLDFHDDPWNGWLRPFLLTRKDGRWLSDGMDRAPLNALERLLEESEEGLVLTGDESKILGLLNMESGVWGEAVVAGEWDSSDQVRVQVESALVRPEKVQAFVKRLFREDELPWLPRYGGSEDEEEYPDADEDGCEPWIVWPSGERNLDRDDPLGSAAAARRLRIARDFSSELSLKEEDPFGRVWKNEKGEIFVRSSVWGCDVAKDPYGPAMGKSLACSGELLKNLLSSSDSDLVVLVKLQRREGLRERPNTYTSKRAVVHVNRSLGVESRVQEGLGKSSFLSSSG